MVVGINIILDSKEEVIGYEHCKKLSDLNKLSRMYKTNNTANYLQRQLAFHFTKYFLNV